MAIFFKEIDAFGPVTCTIAGKHSECLLCSHTTPAFQQHVCKNEIIFMQNDTLLYIANPVKQLLKQLFENSRIMPSFPYSLAVQIT